MQQGAHLKLLRLLRSSRASLDQRLAPPKQNQHLDLDIILCALAANNDRCGLQHLQPY